MLPSTVNSQTYDSQTICKHRVYSINILFYTPVLTNEYLSYQDSYSHPHPMRLRFLTEKSFKMWMDRSTSSRKL